MGRIFHASAMGALRGCLASAVVLVYVPVVVLTCFIVPLARWGDRVGPDPRDLIVPLGIGVLLLLVGPAALAALAVEARNRRLDRLFTPLGLAGFPFALQYRRYEGTFRGRGLQAFVSRGPRIRIEAGTSVLTRLGIAADAEDTRLLAAATGRKALRLDPARFGGLLVFAADEAWAAHLLSHPDVPGLLERLVRFPGPLARRQVVLRPGVLDLTLHLTTAFLRWIPRPEEVHDWIEALVALAGIAESIPPPAEAILPTPLEQRVDRVRHLGLKVNPGVAALVAILLTPVAVLSIAGITHVLRRSTAPAAPRPSDLEGDASLLDLMESLGSRLARESVPATEIAWVLGQIASEERTAISVRSGAPERIASIVVSRDPETGVATAVDYVFVKPTRIRTRHLRARWGEPEMSGAMPTLLVCSLKAGPSDPFRTRVRVRLDGGSDGAVVAIGVFREPR